MKNLRTQFLFEPNHIYTVGCNSVFTSFPVHLFKIFFVFHMLRWLKAATLLYFAIPFLVLLLVP